MAESRTDTGCDVKKVLRLQEYLFDHDEIAHATAALEQWERSNAADVDKPSSK
jgi:hypothetical protein